MYFAYYEGEPICFFIMVPDLNQLVRHLNGKFGLFSKLYFLYLLKVKRFVQRYWPDFWYSS